MECLLQESMQFVNKTHIDFVQLQQEIGQAYDKQPTATHVLQQYGVKFRSSLLQLTHALTSAIEIGSYMDEPLLVSESHSSSKLPKDEIENFFDDMAAKNTKHVIYQGRKGDRVAEYIKKRGQERRFIMHGVLYDATLKSQDNINLSSTSNDREILLSPNTYPWRGDVIQRLTKQLQSSGNLVGLLDDMGSASVAYVAALEQADLMRVAWHLCEIFYWSSPPSEASSTVPAPLITDWARASLDPFAVDDPHLDPSSLEYFWSYVQRLLLRGEITQAVSVLASMPASSDAITISALLQKMPVLTMGTPSSEQFQVQHNQWAAECKSKQSVITHPGASKIIQILSGDEKTISDLSRGWIELLLGFLLFKPQGYHVKIEKLAYRCQQYFSPTPLDELLFSIIQRNHYRSLELSSFYFPPIFAAHLAYMFQQVGIISTSTTENGTTLAEGYLMRYGQSLLSHSWAWTVACDYFAQCGPFAHGLLQEVVDRQQITHDSKFEKMMRVVRTYQLASTPTLRSYAMYLHSKKRYANCAQLLLFEADKERLLQYAAWLVSNVLKIQKHLPKIIAALESLPTTVQDSTQVSILNDSRLSFLVQYQRYLHTSKGPNKASVTAQAQQLATLLHTAPNALIHTLLEHIHALMQEACEPIGVAASVQLMQFLTDHEYSTTTTTTVSTDLLLRLRLVLSQNLAHSFATGVR